MEEQDYLIHYGVLGMKWGVRKARKTGGTYNYTSMKTKRLTKKAAKAKASGKKNAGKIAAKAKASKQSDKNRLEYAKKTSVGKALTQNALLGPLGALTYQKMRANGTSRGKAALFYGLTAAAGALGSQIAGGIAGNVIADTVVAQINAGTLTIDQALNKLMAQTYVASTTIGTAGGLATDAAVYAKGSRATTKSAKKKKK